MATALRVDISGERSSFTVGHRAGRAAWGFAWAVFGRFSPRPLHRWRVLLLRLFGARVSWSARVFPTARVWAPWNLAMGDYAMLGDGVDCYCVGRIAIGAHSVVSQYAYLCGATHDHELPTRPLIKGDIAIGEQAWVAADVFVAPGVTIGNGTVVGARSSVFDDLPAWTVCVGTPARAVKPRVLREDGGWPRAPAPGRASVPRRFRRRALSG
jgi:putative colanic acid biosynthesis acetyltransferase WcaF